MKYPEFKIEINNTFYAYMPKEDITAFQSAQLVRLMLVASHSFVPNEQRVQFLDKYNLWPHFDEVKND